MDALITYASSRFSYSALRSLASLGLKVAVADTCGVGMSQWSRFRGRKYIHADPLIRPEKYIDDINWIIKDSGARFLLPTLHDTEVLARHKDRLPGDVILPIASYESIHMAKDKSSMASYAMQMGVKVPEVVQWHGWEDLEEKLEGMGPVVVKLREGHASKWVYYPENASDALALCKDLATRYSLGPAEMPMVQRRVKGEGWAVGCLYHEGSMLTSFTYRMIREKAPNGGTSTMRISERNPKMEAYAKRLLDGLSWHGLAQVEFKYDRDSDEAWFIEVNPCLWGSIGLGVECGVDMVALLYIASTRGPEKALEMVRPQRLGLVSRWWMGDAIRAVFEVKRHRPLEAIKILLSGHPDFYDDFPPDDLGVPAGEIIQALRHGLRSIWHGPA